MRNALFTKKQLAIDAFSHGVTSDLITLIGPQWSKSRRCCAAPNGSLAKTMHARNNWKLSLWLGEGRIKQVHLIEWTSALIKPFQCMHYLWLSGLKRLPTMTCSTFITCKVANDTRIETSSFSDQFITLAILVTNIMIAFITPEISDSVITRIQAFN